ncbi:MAG: (Fe-S)-binding protein [Chromatiales bacterium]|nr:(Fe-S)-binding protein [Chromatiales bacterium]
MLVKQTEISQEADRCVKCGLCLPHCPTYKLTQDESDSPRGRIALIQAVANDQLDIADAQFHLDRCLSCRACEAACPSGVKYGKLIDGIRTYQAQNLSTKISNLLISTLSYKRATSSLLKHYLDSPLRPLVRRLGSKQLRRMDDRLPDQITPPIKPRTTSAPKGAIAFFTGCVSNLVDQQIIEASIRVLEHCGYQVMIPDQQGCCGAIHLHNGDTARAKQLGQNNRKAFNSLEVEAIINCVSGCGAQLQEYDQIGTPLPHPVMDISDFLIQHQAITPQQLRPLDQTVLLHTPCTLKNVVGAADSPGQLLALIPELTVIPLPLNDCCGAAGSFMLSQPDLADRLREPFIQSIKEQQPDIIATSNTGCAMHLRAGTHAAGLTTSIQHPIELIAQQLID